MALKLANTSSGSSLDAYYYDSVTLSTTTPKTAWSDAENTFIKGVAGANANLIPFLDMGEGDYILTDATATADAQITETAFYVKFIADYYMTLKGLGYTEFKLTVGYKNLALKAKATLANGSSVTLETAYTGSGTSKKMVLKIKALSSFVVPTGDAAKWSDDIKTAIENHIGDGICIPFIYLGTDDIQTKPYTTELDLIGGTWDDQIFDFAYNAFSNSTDGWSVVRNNYDNQIMAFLKTPSGKNVKVIVKNTSNKPLVQIYAK